MARLYGRVHRIYSESGSCAEAIRYLKANFKGFEAYLMNAQDRGIGFTIFYGKQNLGEDDLKKRSDTCIRIAPIVIGSKSGGIFNIILGAVLIIVGAVVDWWTGGTGGNSFIEAGIGILAGGIVQMLTPTPKGLNMNEASANTPNYAFSGPVNTQAQGNPVPLLYGEMICGSAVISAGISTANNVVATQYPTPTALGGMGGGCVAVDSALPGYQDASVVKRGDYLELVKKAVGGYESGLGEVSYAEPKIQPCVTVRTASGIELDCSISAPILCDDGVCRLAPDLIGHLVPVFDEGKQRVEEVVSVEAIGDRRVMHITCENSVFLAGKVRGRYLCHHNAKAIR